MSLSRPEDLQWCDLLSPRVRVNIVYIYQDDINERNAQVIRIRGIYSQLLLIIVQLGEDEITNTGLNSWVKSLFNNLYYYSIILEAYNRRILEVALGINVRVQEFYYNYNNLEDFIFLSNVLYFNNKQQANSNNNKESRLLYFRGLITIVLYYKSNYRPNYFFLYNYQSNYQVRNSLITRKV